MEYRITTRYENEHRRVGELLDGALVGSRRLKICPQPGDLRRLIDQAWDAVAPAASARDVKLFSYVPERLARVCVDADRIIQVLTNLLDNAVRLTPAGGRVAVGCRSSRRWHPGLRRRLG